MKRKILRNKPLIEAIFELRWELREPAPGMKIDPHYKLLLGRLYDRVSNEYPYYEPLPTASIPDEIAGYVVQHRLRKNKDEWPLIQNEIADWLKEAHNLTDNWFFKLIEGELLRRFE